MTSSDVRHVRPRRCSNRSLNPSFSLKLCRTYMMAQWGKTTLKVPSSCNGWVMSFIKIILNRWPGRSTGSLGIHPCSFANRSWISTVLKFCVKMKCTLRRKFDDDIANISHERRVLLNIVSQCKRAAKHLSYTFILEKSTWAIWLRDWESLPNPFKFLP